MTELYNNIHRPSVINMHSLINKISIYIYTGRKNKAYRSGHTV